jgi:hypothetical protein
MEALDRSTGHPGASERREIRSLAADRNCGQCVAMAWEPILNIDPDTWAGVIDGGQLCVGTFDHPIRHVDARYPTDLLPLLERPYTAVHAELDEMGEDRIPVDALPAAAVASQDNQWAELALSWLAEMPPSEAGQRLLIDLEEASWTTQNVRHGARRIRRALYGLGG